MEVKLYKKNIAINKKPQDLVDWEQIIASLHMANSALARLDALMHIMINPQILLCPFGGYEQQLPQEMIDILYTPKKSIKGEPDRATVREYAVYAKTLFTEKERLDQGTAFDEDFIDNLNKILFQRNPRGKAEPKDFRRDGNENIDYFITSDGIEYQSEISLISRTELDETMKDLSEFVQQDFKEPMVQAALLMGQMLAIHPYKDCNGRTARTLIPLYLYHRKLLYTPYFDFADAIERNRVEYLVILQNYCVAGEIDNWIIFFLKMIWEQANIEIKKISEILAIYEEKLLECAILFGDSGKTVCRAFFTKTVMTNQEFEVCLDDQVKGQANSILKNLVDEAIIIEMVLEKQTVYLMPELVNAAFGYPVFVQDDEV